VAGLVLALLVPSASSAAAAPTSGLASVPVGVRVAPGVGTITVRWDPPASHGSSPITGYVVTSSPAGRTCSSATLSCTVTGIVDRTPWRFAVAATNGSGTGARSPLTTPLHSVVVVVVAGQSNATGEESFAVDPVTHRSVFDGTSGADTRSYLSFAGPYWHPAGIPPAPLDFPQVPAADHARAIFGPEVGLARGLWAHGDRDLVVDKVVSDGSSLAIDWRPNGQLFDSLVSKTGSLLEWAVSRGWSPTIGGIFWLQGETDALHATEAASYRRNLTAFIVALRAALPCAPHTPFVLGETTIAPWVRLTEHHHGCLPSACAALLAQDAEVRAAQVDVAATVSDVFRTDTAKLPRAPLQLHLSAAGELDLGAAFASIAATRLT